MLVHFMYDLITSQDSIKRSKPNASIQREREKSRKEQRNENTGIKSGRQSNIRKQQV